MAKTLADLCDKRLHRVVRGGTRGGVTSIHCVVAECRKPFEKQNLARNFAHHLLKEHWEINLFTCKEAGCGIDFAWPDDRVRHEKEHQDLFDDL